MIFERLKMLFLLLPILPAMLLAQEDIPEEVEEGVEDAVGNGVLNGAEPWAGWGWFLVALLAVAIILAIWWGSRRATPRGQHR